MQHPGNFNKRPYNYPYERNPKSLAYIPYTCLAGKIYACGGVNGGKADAYLEMITELAQRVDRDEAKGIIARWHDESHINRYLADHPDYRLLTPAYIYPEGWDLPFEEKMVVLDKQKYIPLPPSKVEVYVRPVWYQRYAGYLKTYGERFVTALRRALLELYFRAHGR